VEPREEGRRIQFWYIFMFPDYGKTMKADRHSARSHEEKIANVGGWVGRWADEGNHVQP
jgi:hypothetical protein